MVNKWFEDLEVTTQDIEKWYATEGKFCSGCIEGKLKEHARRTYTKRLTADKPGENDVKTPFYVHVDVATKLIIGYALKDKTYGEVLHAIEYIDEQHKLAKHKLERLTFDRESSIVVMKEDIEARGIKLSLKAAGQKIGLAEVSIRLIREKRQELRRRVSELSTDIYRQSSLIWTYV